jgi:hypothetical protein
MMAATCCGWWLHHGQATQLEGVAVVFSSDWALNYTRWKNWFPVADDGVSGGNCQRCRSFTRRRRSWCQRLRDEEGSVSSQGRGTLNCRWPGRDGLNERGRLLDPALGKALRLGLCRLSWRKTVLKRAGAVIQEAVSTVGLLHMRSLGHLP